MWMRLIPVASFEQSTFASDAQIGHPSPEELNRKENRQVVQTNSIK